jgi:enoyl-CoA hydratase/carnithine racemase
LQQIVQWALIAHRLTLRIQRAAVCRPGVGGMLDGIPSPRRRAMADWTLAEDEGIAILTFTRPPRNFMSVAAISELGDRLAELGARDDVSVVVVTGGLPGYFVAHADLDDLARLGRGEPVGGDPRAWNRTLMAIEQLAQPVVAAINGQCWGGGCELAMACSVRVAARSATLAQPEVAAGIIPGAGGTQRLPRLVGPGRALELTLTARPVGAEEAAAIGLVEVVLPDEGFLEAALDWAGGVASHPRSALVAAKRAVMDGLQRPLDEGLRLEAELFAECQSDPATLALQDRIRDRYRQTPPDVPVMF